SKVLDKLSLDLDVEISGDSEAQLQVQSETGSLSPFKAGSSQDYVLKQLTEHHQRLQQMEQVIEQSLENKRTPEKMRLPKKDDTIRQQLLELPPSISSPPAPMSPGQLAGRTLSTVTSPTSTSQTSATQRSDVAKTPEKPRHTATTLLAAPA